MFATSSETGKRGGVDRGKKKKRHLKKSQRRDRDRARERKTTERARSGSSRKQMDCRHLGKKRKTRGNSPAAEQKPWNSARPKKTSKRNLAAVAKTQRGKKKLKAPQLSELKGEEVSTSIASERREGAAGEGKRSQKVK